MDDPIGPGNDGWIHQATKDADLVVLAWGNGGKRERARKVYEMVKHKHPVRIGPLTKLGEPSHPLYLPYKTLREPMDDYKVDQS